LSGLLPDLLIPRFASATMYSLHIRPFLVNMLKFLLSLSVISWLIGLSFGFLLCEVQPHVGIRGKVGVKNDGEKVSLNYAFSREDIFKRRTLMKLAKGILAKTSGLWFFELFPGPLLGYVCTDRLLELYVRLFSTSYYHQCGTCPMGPSDQGRLSNVSFAVDEELKVHGISGLRVADASIFPMIPSSPIAATCMAVAEKAAELLLSTSSTANE
jgi:choline dehydrogenase